MADDDVSVLNRFEICQQTVVDFENDKCDQVIIVFLNFRLITYSLPGKVTKNCGTAS